MSDAAGSRIIVISSSAVQAQQFVQRIKALHTSSQSDSDLSSSTAFGSNSIPWTIANRYYTADVHFETYEYDHFGVHHAIGVPAIIYVWAHGEPYKEHIVDLARRLEYHDPEVSLSVRLGGHTTTTQEEDEGLDEFLSSHGFEFIEGDRSTRRSTQDPGRTSDDVSGVPGLPRVVDALSTIMWPNMVQTDSTRARKSRAKDLLDWARDEEGDDGLQALISTGAEDPSRARKSRMEREMEELERWLEAEDDQHEAESARAWINVEKTNAEDDMDLPTPTIAFTHTTGQANTSYAKSGFDDDFTDFISAPAPPGRALSVDYDADRLIPMHTGASYHSLASVSDIDGDGEGQSWVHRPNDVAGDEDDDPDLPSQAEITETSRQIFGTSATLPRLDSSSTPAAHLDVEHSFDHPDADEDDFEMSAFDLSRVLHALQGMKEEIAGMEDGPEKRRAAAKVALGLVYGLDVGKDEETA